MTTLSRTANASHSEPETFKVQLADNIYRLWDQKMCCDLKITVGNQSIHVHKIVLMAQSGFFQAMFSGLFSDKDASAIDLSDVFEKGTDMSAIINYMYTGKIKLCEDNILGILHGASHFLLDQLRDTCEKFLVFNLCPQKCFMLWMLADRYSLPELLRVSGELLATWINYDVEVLQEVADSPSVVMKRLRESGVFKSILSSKIPHLLDLLVNCPSDSIDRTKSIKEMKLYLKGLPQPDLNIWNSEAACGARGTMPATEDVLVACFSPRMKLDLPYSLELHAFVPTENSWRKILSHSFPPGEHRYNRLALLCLGRERAYFVPYFNDEEENNHRPAQPIIYVYSFRNKSFSTIQPPPQYNSRYVTGRLANVFLMDESLCLIVQEDIQDFESAWVVMKYDSDLKQWLVMCSLPVQGGRYFFSVRVLGASLYIWAENRLDREISTLWIEVMPQVKNGVKVYEARLLAPPPPIPATSRRNRATYTCVTNIGCKSISGKIQVCSKIENVDYRSLDFFWPLDSVWYKALIYDCNTDTWAEKEDVKLPHPAEVIIPPALPHQSWYESRWPCRNITMNFWPTEDEQLRRGVEEPFTNVYETTPEMNVGVGRYFAKTTSPYTSDLYLMQPWEKKWERLPSLPFTTDHFPYMREYEVSMDVVETWPLSTFTDYSPEVGQSGFYWWMTPEDQNTAGKPDLSRAILKFEAEDVLSSSKLDEEMYTKWRSGLCV